MATLTFTLTEETLNFTLSEETLSFSIVDETINVVDSQTIIEVPSIAAEPLVITPTEETVAVTQTEETISFQMKEVVLLTQNIISDDDVPYSKEVDFVSDSLIYRGEAQPGTATSDPYWRIRRMTFTIDANGNEDYKEEWADGNANFDNVWDDRLSLNYY